MSATRNQATKPATTEAAKAKRVIGPRDVYLLFADGTDPEFVKQVQGSIVSITMNGRALLKHLQGGGSKPFLTYKVTVEARDAKEGA